MEIRLLALGGITIGLGTAALDLCQDQAETTVTAMHIELKANDSDTLFYRFDAGDQVVIQCDLPQKNGLESVKVSQKDGLEIISKSNICNNAQLAFDIPTHGIYQIIIKADTFTNSQVQIRTSRIPSPPVNLDFESRIDQVLDKNQNETR